jgi:NAD(P)H-nitrite reductase large subunit
LDPVESALVERRLETAGIVLHRRTEIARALGSEGKVVGVETRAGRIVPCDLVCVATGVRPRLELVRTGGLSVDRGVVVSEYLETSAADVFAAGDVAQAYDPAAGHGVLDTLWASAAAQGRVAGLNMSGRQVPYRKLVALNVTCLAGLVTTVVGDVGGEDDPDLVTITRGQSEAWHLGATSMSVVDQQGEGRIRLRLGERTIIGALVLGNQALSEPLHRLVADQVDITTIRSALLQHPEVLPSTLLRFYHDRGAHAA